MIFDDATLDARLRWLVRLRWIAVVAVVVTVLGAAWIGAIESPRPLLAWAAGLAAANLVFIVANRRTALVEVSAAAQVVVDMIVLTFLLHYAGGSGNPFAFFYVFHVIIASILFTPRTAYFTAVLASALYGLLTAADLVRGDLACPRHPIAGQPLEVPRTFALGRWGAFLATVGSSAFFGSTIMGGLRSKQAELRQSRDRLAQAEKLAAVGQLAAGIAHELNTPLGSILVAAQVTQESLPQGTESSAQLSDIVRETRRCKDITRSLLDFSRKQELTLETVDVAEVVTQAVGLVRRESGARAACVAVESPAASPRARADAGALGQVVVNVVKNALDAVEARPAPEVRVRVGPHGAGAEIRVSDNGTGIPPEHLGRIYEPFFTTKDPGKGTGLGLALAYAAMSDMKGEIRVETAQGRGTTVVLVLPPA